VEYLLVSVVGASRPGSNPNGYCGAGQETSLVWIRLGHPDSEIRHQRVDSCAHLQSALRPVTCDDTACETEYIDADPPLSTVVFRYDRKAPGDGFSLVRTPVVKR
jgi:hypothetical protein